MISEKKRPSLACGATDARSAFIPECESVAFSAARVPARSAISAAAPFRTTRALEYTPGSHPGAR
jgi:hypothetical protein